jgi:hypothetical protein
MKNTSLLPSIAESPETWASRQTIVRQHVEAGGHRGMTLSMRSWADAITARGIATEPNRPTHYHGGRPMEWWLGKQFRREPK